IASCYQQAQQLADVVSEISHATGEQRLALDEVARAVNIIDDMTQKNAALAEETASASNSLQGQAKELGKAVSFFRRKKRQQGVTGSRLPGRAR
ncbi:MAG: hypothetical protein K2Q10_10315, partial [Rhodospirillales bacterium]|nr:hypothetical protein [Rhodospirillales bacterium]